MYTWKKTRTDTDQGLAILWRDTVTMDIVADRSMSYVPNRHSEIGELTNRP